MLPANVANSTPRCEGQLLQSQIQERQAITLNLLKTRKFRELQDRMDGFLAAYVSREISDEELFYEFGAFDRWGPFLTPMFQEWVDHYPKSFAAYHAMALHTNAVAFQMRGSAFAKDTSPQQMGAFDAKLRTARNWSMRSIPLHPKPILAYQQLMANAKAIRFDLGRRLPGATSGRTTIPTTLVPSPDVIPILEASIRIQPDNTIVREA